MISRCVVVPHPPLLVPELAGAATEAAEVRAACLSAAKSLAQAAPNWLAVAADPSAPRSLAPSSRGTFRGFGVDVPTRLSRGAEGAVDVDLPLPGLIAGWLREAAGADSVRVELLPADQNPADARDFGASIAEAVGSDEPVGLLVLGEGARCHSDKGPLLRDERADDFDNAAHRAFAEADPDRLLELDAPTAAELGAAGRAAWQCLAGAVLADGREWRATRAELFIPYGVAYHVAVWEA